MLELNKIRCLQKILEIVDISNIIIYRSPKIFISDSSFSVIYTLIYYNMVIILT